MLLCLLLLASTAFGGFKKTARKTRAF